MFVYSMKASSLKFAGIIMLCVATIVTLVAFIPEYRPAATYIKNEKVNYSKIKTNEDRISFLSQFGWEVEKNALEEQSVTIPDEFDKVYTSYNVIQQKQGLDLSKYRRKDVTRYTYKVTNYPDYEREVYANLIIYKNKVIGGDICSADVNGFIHGFSQDVKLP